VVPVIRANENEETNRVGTECKNEFPCYAAIKTRGTLHEDHRL